MVTPMELQVLFMQEGRAARQADRTARAPAEARGRVRRQMAEKGKQNTVESVNDSDESQNVDEEGGQGSAGYFARRQRQDPEVSSEKKTDKKPPPDLEGKGDVMDLKI